MNKPGGGGGVSSDCVGGVRSVKSGSCGHAADSLSSDSKPWVHMLMTVSRSASCSATLRYRVHRVWKVETRFEDRKLSIIAIAVLLMNKKKKWNTVNQLQTIILQQSYKVLFSWGKKSE